MKKYVLLLLFFALLVACGEGGIPPIQDSSELVTLTPLPTNTPRATEIPTSDDANGFGLAFYRAWELGDYLGMYSLLTPSSQALVDNISFVARYEDAMETATVTDISTQALGTLQDGNTAQMEVRVTWQTVALGPIIREYTVPLAFENGRWGIVWDEGLILPELAGGNTLVMQQRIPARANIYDVNGKALAYQGTILTIGVIPGQIEDEPAMLAALSPMLNLPPEEIKEVYAPALPDWYWPIGDVTEATMQQYGPSIQPFIGKGLAEPKPRLARLFSDSGAAPHLIGYTGYIPAEELEEYQAQGFAGDEIVGLAGLERWGEDYLNGERGGTLTVIGPNGDYITTVAEQEPKQARSIYTTLDLEFQTAVEQTLAEATQSLGLRAGAAVVLDVNTGKVLAMASYPSYDPRIFDPFAQDSATTLGAAFNDPDRPLLNRATQGVYPAGSTFKIVTYTAAINSGLYTPDTFYTSTGTWRRLGDNFVKIDWRPEGHGTITLKQALVVSCNSCFYDAAFEMDAMDPDFFPNTALEFGLGQPTGIVGVVEASGTVPSPEWKLAERGEGWVRGDAVNMGIGQGDVQVTPLQMANIIAAVANGGTLYRPTLVDRIGAGAGAPEEPLPVQINSELPLSPGNLTILQESLWKVANDERNGTAAYQFVGLPIQVAGKTGTAEAPPGNSHAWFVGYAPADQPEIAIAVILEHGGEGSAVSAPLFRRLVELYYDITPVTPFPWGG